jgi:hypothetical protein
VPGFFISTPWKEHHHVLRLIRIARKVNRCVVRTAKAIARRVAEAWRRHLDRVASDPGYAAATAAVVAGAFGLMSKRDVLAAVLAGLLGVCVRGTQKAGGAMRSGSFRDETDLY